MDAQTLATILLSLRMVALGFLIATVIKQINQMRTTITQYPAVRIAVFAATIVLLLGQFIPITLDTVVAFGQTYSGRSETPSALGSAYALNNAIKDVIIGALLTALHYRRRPLKV